jgi:hypothetical protein
VGGVKGGKITYLKNERDVYWGRGGGAEFGARVTDWYTTTMWGAVAALSLARA